MHFIQRDFISGIKFAAKILLIWIIRLSDFRDPFIAESIKIGLCQSFQQNPENRTILL